MNKTEIVGVTFAVIILSLWGYALYNHMGFEFEAEATGGAGEISKLIMPMIDRAIEYLEQGNTDAALEEINTLKQELKDTFEVDEQEE